MNNQDKYRRMQCNLEKAIINEAVTNLLLRHYKELQDQLITNVEDYGIFNDTYLKLTYKYDPNRDFVEQFVWIFKQLKNSYYRDDKCHIHYQINDEALVIPDDIDDATTKDVDTDIVTKLKAMLNCPIV